MHQARYYLVGILAAKFTAHFYLVNNQINLCLALAAATSGCVMPPQSSFLEKNNCDYM